MFFAPLPASPMAKSRIMTDRAERLYLDHNASAPLRPAAQEAMLAVMDVAGNPSSVHREGRAARAILEGARREIAGFAGVGPAHVVFTSGASEAAATLLTPNWRDGEGACRIDRLGVCVADHPALRSGGRFTEDRVERLPVDAAGRLDRAALDRWLARPGRPMLAIAAANGETGVLQDVTGLTRQVRRHGGVIVVDASQLAGRRPLAEVTASSDAVILSAHKIGGPKGIGALVLGREAFGPAPLVTGGPQETRRRAGTPAPMLAAGYAAAARDAAEELVCGERMAGMRDAFETDLMQRCAAVILGFDADRLPQTSAFQIAGQRAETVQMAADLSGIAISAGSACQSGKLGRSDALDALCQGGAALDPELGFVRASFGASTRPQDLARLLDALVALGERAGTTTTRAA